MNVEFIKLSDGTTAITDENGKISKRKNETSSEELLVENKIETIDERINVIKKKIKDCKGLVFVSKYMLIAQPIIVAGAAFFGYAFGNLNGLLHVLSIGIIECGFASTMWGITYPISKRILKGFEGKLEKAKELKLEFENDLAKEIELVMQHEPPSINEPISLAQQNEFEISSINKELESAYFDAIHSKPQKLVLQRTPKKRR